MAPANPVRSRSLIRLNRLQSLRSQAKRIRSGPPRTPLWSVAIFIEKCRKRRLSNRVHLFRARERTWTIKTKPFVSQDKKEIVRLPSLLRRLTGRVDRRRWVSWPDEASNPGQGCAKPSPNKVYTSRRSGQ